MRRENVKIKLINREITFCYGSPEYDPIETKESNESFESRINEFIQDHKTIVVKMISENLCYVVYREYWEDNK
jgi:hypothetical protein